MTNLLQLFLFIVYRCLLGLILPNLELSLHHVDISGRFWLLSLGRPSLSLPVVNFSEAEYEYQRLVSAVAGPVLM